MVFFTDRIARIYCHGLNRLLHNYFGIDESYEDDEIFFMIMKISAPKTTLALYLNLLEI